MLSVLLVLALQLKPPEFRPGQALPESPDDHAYAAAQFLVAAIKAEQGGPSHGVGPLHATQLRFLSMYNVPARGIRRKLGTKGNETEVYSPLDDLVQVLLFAVNQVNRRNPPVTLIRVKPDLFAVYLDGPGWSTESWNKLASKDPYFKREWIEESTWNYLTYYTYTQWPIMRADQFVALATVAPDYYNLLGLPATVDEFKRQLGIDEKLLAESYRIKAGVKTDALTVTLNNRILERRQGAFDVWSSNDVVNSKGKKNALRQLDVIGGDIHKLDIDGQEHIFELGNGLWGGFLNNAKGDRVDAVPNNIANDDNYRDRTVIAGRSCITCHDQGVKSFVSDHDPLLGNEIVKLRAFRPEDEIALSARYDGRAVQRNIRTDQENFRSAVEDLVGTSPERIAAMYSNVWRGYVETRVTFHQAALESGLSDDGFISVVVPSIDPNLLYLIQAPGRSIARDVWEDTFNQVQLLKGRPVAPKDRASLPAVARDIDSAIPKQAEAPKITINGNAEQTVNVVITTDKPTTLKGYVKVPGVIVRGSVEPTAKHDLAVTLTPPFVKAVEVDIDEKRISIPVEVKP